MKIIEDNLNTVLEQSKISKGKGKHFTKIKVFQQEIEDGKTCGTKVMIGLLNGQSGYNKLKELGYNIDYTQTNKQFNVNTLQTKDLHTICMNISW